MNEIYIQTLDIGCHTPFYGEILPTITEAIKNGMYTTQFFMGNPKSYKRTKISLQDINDTKKVLDMFPMNIFTHFPYISNLNGSVNSLAWNGDNITDNKLLNLLNELEYELKVMSNFKNSGVVIHPGCYPDRDIGHDTIAKSLNKINFSKKSLLLLENCAGEGRKLCKNFKEIKRVFDGCNVNIKNNLGVCVDTAHLWGSGEYKLDMIDEIDRLFYDFEKYFGINNFKLLHLNDSEVTFGSKKDRHANIGNGYIWSKSKKSLLYLTSKCSENNIPILLETSKDDLLIMSELSS